MCVPVLITIAFKMLCSCSFLNAAHKFNVGFNLSATTCAITLLSCFGWCASSRAIHRAQTPVQMMHNPHGKYTVLRQTAPGCMSEKKTFQTCVVFVSSHHYIFIKLLLEKGNAVAALAAGFTLIMFVRENERNTLVCVHTHIEIHIQWQLKVCFYICLVRNLYIVSGFGQCGSNQGTQ